MSGIFISYRREDAAGHAGRLFDRLAQHFGRDRVFMDVAGIEPGVDFVEVIEHAVGSCAVLIVVIGKQWARATDAAGNRWLEDPNDFVRLEAVTALKRNVRVIPLLVEGAPLPAADSLPEDLRTLTRRNAFELRDSRWEADIVLLVNALEKVLGSGGKPAATARDAAMTSASFRRGWAPYAVGASLLAVLVLGIALWIIGRGKDGEQNIYPPKPVPPGEGSGSVRVRVATEQYRPRDDGTGRAGRQSPGLAGRAARVGRTVARLGRTRARHRDKPGRHRKTPGTVLAQQPGAGTLVQPGARVDVVLAAAPAREPQPPSAPKLEMPSFIGLPVRTARGQIAEAGLRVARWSQRPVTASDQVDRVVSQQPAAGTAVEKGAAVEIVVGAQAASPQAEVPAMVGLSMKEALSALEQAGLELGRRSGKASAREPGTILRQSVAAGTRVAPGSAVDLVYAHGDRLRRAPDGRTRP